MLEESDTEEEDENFELYLSDNEDNEEWPQEQMEMEEETDMTPLTSQELEGSEPEQITETILIHEPPVVEKRLTRSQTTLQKQRQASHSKINAEAEETEKRNDSSDSEEGEVIEEQRGEEEEIELENKNEKEDKLDPIIDFCNVIESKELLFLRKDNITYFVDTNGNPLDSGSQKLFERNALPNIFYAGTGKGNKI